MLDEFVSRTEHFFKWWRGELNGLSPKEFARKKNPRENYEVIFGHSKLRVGRSMDSPARLYDVTAEGVEELKLELIHKGFNPKQETVHIQLSTDDVYQVIETYPLAAKSRLSQFLKLKIQQDMPFTDEDVYGDSAALTPKNETATIEVYHGFVKRSLVDDVLALFTEANVTVHKISASFDTHDLNFLPVVYGASRRRKTNRRYAAACLFIFFSLGFFVLSLHARMDRNIARLNQDLKAEQLLAKSVRDSTETLNGQVIALNDLRRRKQQNASMSHIIETLATALPLDTSLINLEINQKQIKMTGLSKAAPALLEQLETQNTIGSVEFLAPVTLDKRTGKERFSLALTYQDDGSADVLSEQNYNTTRQ